MQLHNSDTKEHKRIVKRLKVYLIEYNSAAVYIQSWLIYNALSVFANDTR